MPRLKPVVLGCLAAALIGVTPAVAAPAATCAGMSATAGNFTTAGLPGTGWLENMGFDGHGGMWVSELFANKIVHYDASGRPGRSVAVTSPGASLLGPDGMMYAAFGDAVTAVIPGTGVAGVVRFDPNAAAPVATPYAKGFTMANGAAFDSAGNLYVANSVGSGIVKIRPGGSIDNSFATAAPVSGADGLAVEGNTLYVTLLTDPNSSIVAIPLDKPAAYKPLAELSNGGLPYLLDDQALGPDGALYVASNLGQIIRVDRSSGASCVLLHGLPPVDSVRFPIGFAPYDDTHDIFMTSETGVLLHASITGLQRAAAPAATAQPALRISVTPRSVRRGHRVTLKAIVSSPGPSCRAGVHVRVGSKIATTDARGRAIVRITFHSAAARSVRAAKPGCTGTRTSVKVR